MSNDLDWSSTTPRSMSGQQVFVQSIEWAANLGFSFGHFHLSALLATKGFVILPCNHIPHLSHPIDSRRAERVASVITSVLRP